jgi:hypothetical protein
VTFNYSLAFGNDKDRIRLRIGDTDATVATNQRLEDEEIAELLLEYGSLTAALPVCAESLAAKFAKLATDRTVGTLTIRYAKGRYETLMDLAATLRARAAASTIPYAGGISQSDKDNVETNTDRAQPSFVRGMFDNPDAGQQSPDPIVDGQPT